MGLEGGKSFCVMLCCSLLLHQNKAPEQTPTNQCMAVTLFTLCNLYLYVQDFCSVSASAVFLLYVCLDCFSSDVTSTSILCTSCTFSSTFSYKCSSTSNLSCVSSVKNCDSVPCWIWCMHQDMKDFVLYFSDLCSLFNICLVYNWIIIQIINNQYLKKATKMILCAWVRCWSHFVHPSRVMRLNGGTEGGKPSLSVSLPMRKDWTVSICQNARGGRRQLRWRAMSGLFCSPYAEQISTWGWICERKLSFCCLCPSSQRSQIWVQSWKWSRKLGAAANLLTQECFHSFLTALSCLSAVNEIYAFWVSERRPCMSLSWRLIQACAHSQNAAVPVHHRSQTFLSYATWISLPDHTLLKTGRPPLPH